MKGLLSGMHIDRQAERIDIQVGDTMNNELLTGFFYAGRNNRHAGRVDSEHLTGLLSGMHIDRKKV